MKEKRYTLPEEQKDAAFAAEPAPAYHGNAAIAALPEDEWQKKILTGIKFLLAGIRLMKKKPWLGLKLLRRSMKGQARLQILMIL